MAGDWKLRGYVLERVLGSGASGDVWRARAAATGEEVAVKRIRLADREQARRARAEAALLTALDHPNLVRLRDLVRAGDSVALILELAGNGSLRDLLDARGRLTPGEAITALAPVAAAVSYLHGRSIVHGDVSAANVVFTEAGAPLLGDVGVARITGDRRDAVSTPIYVDPAVAGGALPTPASDVFMLGALAYHVLTGRPLWSGDSTIAILARAVGGVPLDLTARLADAGVPAAMAEVVARALDTRPHARGSAVEFALDLRQSAPPAAVEFRAGTVGPDRVPPDRPPGGRHRAGVPRSEHATGTPRARPRPDIPRRPVRRSRSRAVAAGVLLLAGGVAAVAVATAGLGHGSSAHPAGHGTRAAGPPPVHLPATVPGHPPRSPAPRSSTPRSPAPRSSTPAPESSAPRSGAPARWMQVLAGLDMIRAQAYAARRPELLARVYAPGALLADDTARLRRIVPPGCGLTGALTAYRSVTVLTAPGPRTVLTVVVALPRTRLVCDDADAGTAPAVGPRHMRIELTDTDDGPRISDERPI